jgi:hypothetical protein
MLRKQKTFSGSLWRESKLALARSYATATQAGMHFGTGVELRTNPRHSFSPHVPFHSPLTVSPSLSSGINSTNRPMNTDQIPGTFIVLNVVCFVICLLVVLKIYLREKKIFNRFLFIYLDPVEVNGDEYQNIEMSRDKSTNNNDTNIIPKQKLGETENQNRPDSLNFTNEVNI